MKPLLAFVIGPTNVGKSTFLSTVAKTYGNRAGLIEVGKILRAKYPPGYFNGQAAPKHTAGEAWQLMVDGVDKALKEGKEVILVDGQPRDVKQCQDILDNYILAAGLPFQAGFIHLFASTESRKTRAEKRDGQDPEKLKLSLARMEGDLPSLYVIMSMILSTAPYRFSTFDTDRHSYITIFEKAERQIREG